MKLKTKLIALNTVILSIVGAMMFLQFRAAQNKQKYEIRKGFSQVSDKLQKSVSNAFYLYYHNVQSVALNKTIHAKNFEDINFYFNELVSLYPLYDFIVFVDTKGNYIASNSLSSEGKKLNLDKVKTHAYSSETWFKNTKDGKFVEDYEKKIYGSYMGEIHKNELVSNFHGREAYGNFFATVVSDEFGEPLGYLATFLDEKWVQTELEAANAALVKEGKAGAKFWLANAQGLNFQEFNEGKFHYNQFLKQNFVEEYRQQINESKNLKEPSFISAMFMRDHSPLFAYSDFSNPKWVDALGWKIFIEMESKTAFSAISVAENIFTSSFFVILFVGSFFAFLVSNQLSNNLLKIAKRIAGGSITISDASSSLSDHSGNLSRATSDQASSLQETVASLNEISAMVNKNTDASQNSKDLSAKSREAAETGKGTINKMLSAIDEISDANSEIIRQMNQNAEEIQQIISVIKEIEDKTKVINDIVFQTKLLSFNASVEAARAGEHGKGFSVVAEEVGNLAQHSGDAAKQIEEMLVQSVTRVESIARNTESKVQDLIKRGTEKVDQGKNVANQCDGALGEILDHASHLDKVIEEIAIASVEQSQGIQEISRAMSELDKVTKQNSMIAHETSTSTMSLNDQAKGLKEISMVLTDLITGGKESKLKLTHVDEAHIEEDGKADNKVLKLESKKMEKKAINKPTSVSEKKVASSDIAVPTHSDGEWEDI